MSVFFPAKTIQEPCFRRVFLKICRSFAAKFLWILTTAMVGNDWRCDFNALTVLSLPSSGIGLLDAFSHLNLVASCCLITKKTIKSRDKVFFEPGKNQSSGHLY
eukprot:Lithocolla_globosa_v1_NODE_6681_length_1050_cov_146.172864.p2 type:complete len:104 gc:universal NODE_6681_length_1050_cov_146.172864:411-100(-)